MLQIFDAKKVSIIFLPAGSRSPSSKRIGFWIQESSRNTDPLRIRIHIVLVTFLQGQVVVLILTIVRQMEDSDWSACEIDFINTAKLDKNFISSIYKKQVLIMLKVYSLGRANTTSCVFCQCSKLVHLDIWIYMCVFLTFNRVNAPGESFFVTPSPHPFPPLPPHTYQL